MKLASILTPERTKCGMKAASKKKALEQIAEFVCESRQQLDPKELFEKLIERERLGTTGLGNGIAIPHCRLPNCESIIGALVQLEDGIDYGAFDNEAVRVVFLLIVPVEEVDEHLQTLSALAGRLQSDDYRAALLNAKTDMDLYNAAIKEDG
jgi:PTS system nitrogen regulatory IIA component